VTRAGAAVEHADGGAQALDAPSEGHAIRPDRGRRYQVQLVVWNSRGNKWNTFWNQYFGPLAGAREDILGLLVESGWGPWVTPGQVRKNFVYTRASRNSWFNATADNNSAFCQGVSRYRGRAGAFWVPWVRSYNALKTNTRCSMGAVTYAGKRRFTGIGRLADPSQGTVFYRPVCRVQIGQPGSGGGLASAEFSTYLVHLISGNPGAAQHQMDTLINFIRPNIPQGSGAIIVGDFNINILGNPAPFVLPAHWSLLRTNGPTQQSGGELDYGLLYDPTGNIGLVNVQNVQQFQTGNNTSDHAVLQYGIPL
jgi:hypothetical protein